MEVPQRWHEYRCDDYFNSTFAADGYWDDLGQLWLIEPHDRIAEIPEAAFLQVGRPGADGIGFGYRKGEPGIWAWYPYDDTCEYLAPTLTHFLEGWLSGRIKV